MIIEEIGIEENINKKYVGFESDGIARIGAGIGIDWKELGYLPQARNVFNTSTFYFSCKVFFKQ